MKWENQKEGDTDQRESSDEEDNKNLGFVIGRYGFYSSEFSKNSMNLTHKPLTKANKKSHSLSPFSNKQKNTVKNLDDEINK
jgi:hypothetical protein